MPWFKIKPKNFVNHIELYEDLRFFVLHLPQNGTSSDFPLAEQIFVALNSLNGTFFLGFFATKEIAFFYFASSACLSEAISHEILARYPYVRLLEVELDSILEMITDSEQSFGASYFLKQDNYYWLPLKIPKSIIADPLASLFSIVNRLGDAEMIWFFFALQPRSRGQTDKVYTDLMKVPKNNDNDGSLQASIAKLEQPLFLAQITLSILGNSSARFDSLISSVEGFLGQFTGHNNITLADDFYKIFSMSPETSIKVLENIVLPHAIIRPDPKIEWTASIWSVLNSQELAGLWHIPDKTTALPSQMLTYQEEIHMREETISILFLAADPTNESRLRLGKELREIQEKLQLSQFRDKFNLDQRMAVRPSDIVQGLLDVSPEIVHFSGHGAYSGALCFENDSGKSLFIQPDALAALFKQFATQVNCVILNACYSEIQANAIAEHIEYVIGMNKAIGDEAAIAFTVGFYQGLGANRTVEEAYHLGCVQIGLHGIPEQLTPVLVKKQ